MTKNIFIAAAFFLLQFAIVDVEAYQGRFHREENNDYKEPSSSKFYPKNYEALLGKIKGLDDSLLSMHFKLYEGYVKNTNLLLANIQELRDKGEESTIAFGALKRRFGWEYDGMVLHEYYFSNLMPDQRISPVSSLYKKIERDFGSFENWVKDFKATGMMRGIGWVVLYHDHRDDNLYNVWINEHDHGHLAGGNLLLVMDVWEHAYITQYGIDRKAYIDTFFENVNWKVVQQRFEVVEQSEEKKAS